MLLVLHQERGVLVSGVDHCACSGEGLETSLLYDATWKVEAGQTTHAQLTHKPGRHNGHKYGQNILAEPRAELPQLIL